MDRSYPHKKYLHVFAVILWCCCTLFVGIMMFLVYRSVRNVEKEALKYSFARYSSSRKATLVISRRVMIQGVLYGSVLLYPAVLFSFYTASIHNSTVLLLGRIFFPLLGFFNALIYAIPSFRQVIKKMCNHNKAEQNTSKSSWLKRWRRTLSMCLLRSKTKNGMTDDNIPARESKSDRGRNAELQVFGYNQGEYSNHPKKIMFPTKQMVHTEGPLRGLNRKNNGQELRFNLLSSSELRDKNEEIKEEIKSEDSNFMTTSNPLQNGDVEQQVDEPLALSSQSFSDLERIDQHYFTAFDVNTDIFESANNNEEIDSDDESFVDDYLKLMRRME